MSKIDLARKALGDALKLRSDNEIQLTDALSIYDLAEQIGVREVRFVEIPSLEEMYWKNEKTIFVSSLRPAGRQAFSCAHGLGHHVYGHGMCIASVSESENCDKDHPDEFLAEVFAGFLLMPKSTVCHGFHCRGWDAKSCTPLQVQAVATWLGVGYATLVQHMYHSLKLISRNYADRLLAISPAKIRLHVLGSVGIGQMVMVDEKWTGRPVDIDVGDTLVLKDKIIFNGANLEFYGHNRLGSSVVAKMPGLANLYIPGTEDSLAVRVSRKAYHGRNKFRFEEDPDYDFQDETLNRREQLIASMG